MFSLCTNRRSRTTLKLLDRERGLEALRAQGDVERAKLAKLQSEVRYGGLSPQPTPSLEGRFAMTPPARDVALYVVEV